MPFFKSVLPKPNDAVVAGVAVAGSVFAIYQLGVGSLATAHASDANHPANESARRKAGYMGFLFVSAITLLTRDTTVATLGYGTIVAMECAYRHSIMVSPATGELMPPDASEYTLAGQQLYAVDETG